MCGMGENIEVDDSKDKIRRNLVTVSAVILLLAWLDLPLNLIAERVIGVGGSMPIRLSAAKIWSASLILLLYLGWRFKHSSEAKEARVLLVGAARVRSERLLARLLKRDIAKFNRTAIERRRLRGSLDTAVESQRKGSVSELLEARPELNFEGLFDPEENPRRLRLGITWHLPEGRRIVSTGPLVEFYLNWFDRVVTSGYGLVVASINTNQGLEVVWPGVLWFAACSVVGWKLVRLFIG